MEESEVRSQKSEVRSQKSEVGGQKSEVAMWMAQVRRLLAGVPLCVKYCGGMRLGGYWGRRCAGSEE